MVKQGTYVCRHRQTFWHQLSFMKLGKFCTQTNVAPSRHPQTG
jgi:hypothetical protein